MSRFWFYFDVFEGVLWVLSLAAIPVVVKRLPVDFFSRDSRPMTSRRRKIAKNMAAAALVLFGIFPALSAIVVMIGLSLAEFPGKARLVRKLVSYKFVWRTLNGTRRFVKAPPFEKPV